MQKNCTYPHYFAHYFVVCVLAPIVRQALFHAVLAHYFTVTVSDAVAVPTLFVAVRT
ncbi:MAG: hypothetical protein Greene101415_820 [Parcubacteria group bacterium Greene1014_15]|nr:MAG: hypothetical protein Greene101415_820 [Parcubacteria group bacterium Greene1014_15]